MIINTIQSILNSKSTLNHKVLYIIYYSVNVVKKLSCRYKYCSVNYCNNILIQSKNTYNNTVSILKNLTEKILYRYHLPIILLIKKLSIRWGIMAKSYLKSTSDNMYYVNLMPKQHDSYSEVVNCPYFARLLRKITRWGGILGGATSRLSKNTKTLISIGFLEEKIKKGLSMYSGLCKLISSSTMCRRSNGVVGNGGTCQLGCKACSGADSFGVSAIVVPGGHGSQNNRHARNRGLIKPFSLRRVCPHKNGLFFFYWELKYA